MEQNELYLLGVDFRTAPASVREALSFNQLQAGDLLRRAKAALPEVEALVLSTCNRTEFYLSFPAGRDWGEKWIDYLRRLRPDAPILHSECMRYEKEGSSAARHLFRVACGLESMILGDVQILGQVKEACATAGASGTLDKALNRVCVQAIRAGKRARRETSIGVGTAGIGSALADMLLRRTQAASVPSHPGILILGAGAAARNIGQHLAKRGLSSIRFMNRTESKAKKVASDCGGEVAAWADLDQELLQADIVIAATSATEPVLSSRQLDCVVGRRSDRALLVVDAGMPRNVEPGSRAEVIDIDAIRERQDEVLERRREAIPRVEGIIQDELERWEKWNADQPLESVIKTLYRDVETISQDAAMGLTDAAALTPTQVQSIIQISVKRLLHDHVRNLRSLTLKRERAL